MSLPLAQNHSLDRQIRNAKECSCLGKSHGVLIVLKDTVEVLSPEVLAYDINLLLVKKGPSGEPRFSEISAVWILSDNRCYEDAS